jgi:hypothetical protein
MRRISSRIVLSGLLITTVGEQCEEYGAVVNQIDVVVKEI